MAWQPQSFQPELDKSAVINELYPQAIPSTNFVENAGIVPAQQPWQPSTFTPQTFDPETTPQAPQEEPGLMGRISADIEKRRGQGKEAIAAYRAGDQTGLETALQVFGKSGAGTINDVAGEALKSLFDSEAVQSNPLVAANRYASKMLSGTAPAIAGEEAIRQIGEAYQGQAMENPRAARNLEALGNIVALAPVGKAAPVVGEGAGTVLKATGEALEAGADSRLLKQREAFVHDLIMPKATPSVRENLVGRTKEVGLNRKQVVELTPQEKEIASVVAEIPGVKKSKSLQGNANAIQDANRAEADALINRLRDNDVEISDDIIVNGLSSVRDRLSKNRYLSGVDASKAANGIVEDALELIMDNPRTASGLLQARKDLDAMIKAQKPNAFDAADAPVTVALREVRQEINNMVNNAVPDAEVKASLRKQSNLYRAHENIATKAKDEAKSRVGRAAQSASKAVTLKNGIAGTLALGGLGATGALPIAAGATGGALAAYYGGRALTSPAVQKAVGVTLNTAGSFARGEVPKIFRMDPTTKKPAP